MLYYYGSYLSCHLFSCPEPEAEFAYHLILFNILFPFEQFLLFLATLSLSLSRRHHLRTRHEKLKSGKNVSQIFKLWNFNLNFTSLMFHFGFILWIFHVMKYMEIWMLDFVLLVSALLCLYWKLAISTLFLFLCQQAVHFMHQQVWYPFILRGKEINFWISWAYLNILLIWVFMKLRIIKI